MVCLRVLFTNMQSGPSTEVFYFGPFRVLVAYNVQCLTWLPEKKEVVFLSVNVFERHTDLKSYLIRHT